jgi:hypothetical protein
MDGRSVGVLIIAVGVIAIVIGLAVAAGLLSWFGRLPGDIRIERDNVRIYAPIVSMLLISVVLSAVLAILRRLL